MQSSAPATILLMHSSARISDSCEVWTRRRIEPVTCSYSVIFLIIRSLCWTASYFQPDPTGNPGFWKMRALWSVDCKCELWRGVSIFKNVGSSLGFIIKFQAILQVFSKRCWPIKDSEGSWFPLLLMVLFFCTHLYVKGSVERSKRTFALCET